ncbi:MAG TPA: DUF3185 family protein [Planctomycetota bacterium]|nr:DUF3185 family protein [Planctomycetota bacterium]
MYRALGVALLVAGAVLLIFGLNASHSFSSGVSKVFTGTPTDKSIWLVVGGVVAAVAGLFFTLSPGGGRKFFPGEP